MKRERIEIWRVLMTAALILMGLDIAVADAERSLSLRRSGPRFSMEFRDADLKDVLRALGQENNLNIIVGEEIDGKLTLSFQEVTLHEALEAILRMNNLTSLRDGNIIRVMRSPFPEGEEHLETRMLPINYASAKEVQDIVKELLSKKGSVSSDTRTNTLVIRDVPENVDKLAEVIHRLDSKTPVVMIEAKIVEVSTSFSRELGVQWGGLYTSTSGSRATTLHGGGFKNNSDDLFAQALTGGIGLSGGPFAVNLPASVGPGMGGSLGLAFGNVANTRLLDIQLSALEDAGKGRILSNPRIMTLNNKEAKISSGTEILVPTTSIVATSVSSSQDASGLSTNTGVTTIDAKLELTVTPQVTADGQILMHLKTDKKDPDFGRQVQDIPPLNTRTAETNLLVGNRETVVIGGIYTRNQSNNENGVPWLSKIPLLGWLFKKQSTNDTQTELLIFITPTIHEGVEPAAARVHVSGIGPDGR